MKIFEEGNKLNICLGQGENPPVDIVVWKDTPDGEAQYTVKIPNEEEG